MAEDQHFRLAVQLLAVSLVVFAIHFSTFRQRTKYYCLNCKAQVLSTLVPIARSLLSRNGIVIRDMSWKVPKLIPRSAPVILLVLTVAAASGFAAVSHLVTRYTLNQQARGRKLYAAFGLNYANAGNYSDAINAFRAALTCDPTNSQYQLSLARVLRDSNDPQRLEEAESYLLALWQRAPQDASVNLALARVAAHRGSIEDAIRYYHNAMYGVWDLIPMATAIGLASS